MLPIWAESPVTEATEGIRGAVLKALDQPGSTAQPSFELHYVVVGERVGNSYHANKKIKQ